jgi:alkylhydroperoxidase/carboxymuconolactone decarboxylase family protein YurZ
MMAQIKQYYQTFDKELPEVAQANDKRQRGVIWFRRFITCQMWQQQWQQITKHGS